MKRALASGLAIIALAITAAPQTAKHPHTSMPTDQAAPPSVSITPASVEFKDQVTKKASRPERVTVTNTGGKALYINTVVIEGDNKEDFVVSHDTCTGATVGAGKSCVIDIVFTPAVKDKRRATLTVTDNAYDSPQRVRLSGSGINSADVPPHEE
ncbi:MAG TPA: choice-of-anchor D domain-containing protein [Blastocatellia bacterium]|nr:choice-of-anchor D domain-containing protein [Blastocatellia bacterium]